MFVITGATGNTGSVAAELLLAAGEKVRVIGRDPARMKRFVTSGADAFVGDVEDEAAMTKAFTGATAVYLILPSAPQRDDWRAYQERVSDAYAGAVMKAGVKHGVTLSSIGAQSPEAPGPIRCIYAMEQKLNRVPGLNVLHLRPTHFLENLLMSVEPVRAMGFLPGAFLPDIPIPMIATRDIGAVAAERLRKRDFAGRETRELLGPRDLTMKEVASVLGKAIGRPDLSYRQVPFSVIEMALAQMGMPKSSVALVVEMWEAVNNGKLRAEEARSKRNTTPTTIESFAAEVFAPAFQGKAARA